MVELGLSDTLVRYLTLDPSRRVEHFAAFRAEIDSLVQNGQAADAVDAIRQAVSVDVDYPSLLYLYRALKKAKSASPPQTTLRVAVLGSYTTQQLTWLIELMMFGSGVDADIYEADYGVVRQEIYNPESEFYRFNPQVVVLLTGYRDVARLPDLGDVPDSVAEMAESEIDNWKQLWNLAFERLGCQIVQNTFATPPWQTLGHLESRVPSSPGSYLRRLNQALFDEAPPYVLIHDMDRLSAEFGKWAWADDRFYFDAKLPCAPEQLPVLAHSISSLVLAAQGKSKKCLVLDLDNTLWGGVIGDDGLGGIVLGQHDPQGEAYIAFQQYVKRLKAQGVILAVCSKNDEENAREPFEKHPEMVLKLNDITSFAANWNDKASNLRSITDEINIGLDSLVFFDDNPAERGLVRRYLPQVAVPEVPEDVAGYIRALQSHRYFEMVSLSKEDLERSDMYAADARRKTRMTSAAGLDDYLRSLNMRGVVEPLNDVNFERFAQLINKSNQFNLTTKRYSHAELEQMRSDASWVTRGFRLVDEFGDNGLICVVLCRKDAAVMEIDTWVMSCRVLNRGVEQFVMSHLFQAAQDSGAETLLAEYCPTSKNGMVKNHYQSLGFEMVDETSDGITRWEISLSSERIWEHYIQEELQEELIGR